MADFAYAGHLPPIPVADYRYNRLAHWASRDLDTLFSAARAHASLTNGRAPPPISFSRAGTDPISHSQPYHNTASAKVANRAASLAAVGEYRRAMEALSSIPVASGRGVHEELSRLQPQDDDNLVDLLPHPFSLPRTCKATHPTRSTSSCGVPCVRRCQQIPRLDRCYASLLCCMAVHLPCSFTTH
jgi:hypothetical protein